MVFRAQIYDYYFLHPWLLVFRTMGIRIKPGKIHRNSIDNIDTYRSNKKIKPSKYIQLKNRNSI